jgi:transcriptional regulator with XRE-family HTH domain
MNLVKNIRRYIDFHNYNIGEIAKYLKIDQCTFSEKLDGFMTFDIVELHKLAKLLGVSVDNFIEYKELNFEFSSNQLAMNNKFTAHDLFMIASFNKIIDNYIKMRIISEDII